MFSLSNYDILSSMKRRDCMIVRLDDCEIGTIWGQTLTRFYNHQLRMNCTNRSAFGPLRNQLGPVVVLQRSPHRHCVGVARRIWIASISVQDGGGSRSFTDENSCGSAAYACTAAMQSQPFDSSGTGFRRSPSSAPPRG